MRQQYQEIKFRSKTLDLIDVMNYILEEFRQGGYTVTVRQLYYQMVARDLIPNTVESYKKITGTVNDARLAGLMDWDMIEDRTRAFEKRSRWESPASIVGACAEQFHMDMWDDQETRVFCIVEKEALAGVLAGPCYEWDVPLLAARGYPSVTVVREFVERDLLPVLENGQNVQILHLGDHDPSGIDMTRDLRERINLFADLDSFGKAGYGWLNVERIALTMDQIDDQKPPPNPAKETDSRFAEYRQRFGDESWELDALRPQYLNDLIETHIEEHVDTEKWAAKEKAIKEGRAKIAVKAKELEEA
jgi:hypothetical protein